jgi:hypothetical protein
VDRQGRVLVAYADGCTGTCVDDASTTSSGKTGAVLRQSTGRGLYAAQDGTIGAVAKPRH